MAKLFEYSQANPLVPVLALLVAALLVHFLIQYVARGLSLRSRLIQAVGQIGSLSESNPALRQELQALFTETRLGRAWREFAESLHEPRSGTEAAVAARATQPAAAFFNLETVVDPWIGSEYFRHLPGILTGFGIIGTFFGLIQGLVHFDPSLGDSADLKRGLGELFGHVRDAFMFSGGAITAAIAVTISEKWIYSSCAKWVLELAAELDRLFKVGVGEDYLASLLQSSQDSAVQVRHLKDAMVQDLSHMLTNLTDRQVQATRQMSADLARSIRQSLQEPLAEIARTVAAISGRDTEAVRDALEQLMTAFLAQMRETLGRQLGDLSALIQQAAQSIYKVELAMHSLLDDLQKSSKESAAGTQAAVHELIKRMSESQRAQGEAVSAAMRGVLVQLNEAAVRLAAAQEDITRRTREGNDAAAHMRRQLVSTADSHVAAIAATRDFLDRFGGKSAQMIDKLSAGTASVVTALGSLQHATEQMSRAGLELATLAGQAQKSSHDMVRASSHLASVAQNVGNSIHQLSNAAVRFEGVATSASVEANARRQLLISLQDVIDQSHIASREFVRLAQETRKALGVSVEHFDADVGAVLGSHVKAYQKQLSDSVGSLREALDELAVRAGRDRD